MITPLTENPAIMDPRKNLTSAESDALAALDFFKQQRLIDGRIHIGNKRFSLRTIKRLEEKELVKGKVPKVELTTGGGLALYRLKGGDSSN